MSRKVLIIGSGGREYALAWKLAQSSRVGKLYVAPPGNGGTNQIAESVLINSSDISGLARYAEKNTIDLTVVGPDDPLALGVVNAFQAKGLRIFGPTQSAAEIEWSKVFAKELMREISIPTASFSVFKKYDEAFTYIYEHGAPIVVKASGLALGKGAYVCKTVEEAESALAEIMINRVHKDAGSEVVIEEFLNGREISVHAFCDGKNYVLLPSSQDHKSVEEGNQGKNTGGMGIVAPVPWVTAEILRETNETIIRPILKALAERGRSFAGLLYPGLKITDNGLKVLEFNARFGDPETQSYMRLLKTDLFDILEACVNGTLSKLKIEWHSGFAVSVVIASGGYPDAYKKGIPIYGIAEAERVPGVVLFHAGTSFTDKLRTSGGRVLGITAVGDTLRSALDRAYEAARLIKFKNMYYRET